VILSPADVALVVVVSAMATAMAYIRKPVLKAAIYLVPLPFTAAAISAGFEVEVTHALGVLLIPTFIWTVRWLHLKGGLPVVVADVVGAGAYCAAGWTLVRVVPRSDLSFWAVVGLSVASGLVLGRVVPNRQETAHRTSLPVALKVPLGVVVVLCLVALKGALRGVMTTFPYVGVFAVYEARHSLWTLGRASSRLLILLPVLLIATKLMQHWVGLGWALALGWLAYLVALPLVFPEGRSALLRAIRKDAT